MDEQEGVSSVTSVSEPTVGANVHEDDELLTENLGCDGQDDEPYNEGDGGEIMVEVVGSDVFVDGVCGDDGELGQEGSGKADTLDEHRDFQLRDAKDSSGRAGQEDDGNTGNGVEGVLDVAGSFRDVAKAASTEIIPGVPSITACSVVEKVNFSVSEDDVEGNVVRSTESATHADLASLDVGGSSWCVYETVDNEAVPTLPSETADRVLEQVSIRVREEEAEGNVVRSTVSVEGSAAPADLTLQRADLSDDGVWNPGIDPLVGSSSFVPQDSSNLETEEASNLRLDSSEKDESSVREIVGKASEKEISSHARDQVSDHPAEGPVSWDSGMVQKTHSEVETMETDAHDHERYALGHKDENSHHDSGMVQKAHSEIETMETDVHDQQRDDLGNKDDDSHQDSWLVQKIHSEVETMETDVRDQQRDDLGNKDEDSHQYSGLVQKTHSEVETMETDVHDQETVGLGNKDENSHPDVEPMEIDVYDQDDGLLNKDKNNNSNAVVELLETINHQVPAGHDNLGDIPVSQDSASSCADEMVSLRPDSKNVEDKREDIKVGSGDSRISVEHTLIAHDHALGINGNNVPLHPEKQEHGFKENLAAENGVIGFSFEKANHAEVWEFKVDNMHEDKNNLALCTQTDASHMETQTGNHKSLEGTEVSSCKVPIPSDNESLGGSDELPDVQPKVADGVSEFTHNDFPLSVQASAHDTRKLEEMEVEGVRHETTGTLTFPMNDEILNIVEVDARLENDATIGPLETSYEPACRNDGASVEMNKDGDAQLGTTTASLSCTVGKIILEDETRVSFETMLSTREMNTRDETNKATHFLPEGLDGNVSLQLVENESVLLFDNYPGKEGDPQMSAVSSNDDAMTEAPEGTSLACQDTSRTSDSNTVNVKLPSLLKENDFKVEVEQKVEAKDTALGDGPAQGHDLAHDTKKDAVTGMHSNITEESESFVNREGVVEHVNMLAFEMDHDYGNVATADKILNEENNSNLEGAIKFQAAINSGAGAPPLVRHQIVETCISHSSNAKMNQANEDQDSFKANEISSQIVENSGICEESSKRYGVDKSTGVASFGPDKLMHYMKAVALSPTCQADRLDITIAQAQLVAFCHFKGYRLPPEFLLSGELLENDGNVPHEDGAIDDKGHASEDSEQHPISKVSTHKRKYSSKDISHHKMKERSLSELMDNGEYEYSPDGEDDADEKTFTSSKKRKVVDSRTDGSDKKTSVYAAKVSTTASVSPKPSFRVGECIQRVASQLTRSASLLKCTSDQSGTDVQLQESPKGNIVIPTELPSPNELLSQLQLVAWAPLKGYNFLKTITTFFSGFRNSVAVGHNLRRQNSSVGRPGGGRKKRASQTVASFAEEFEFDDVNDSYWTDRIVQNYGEEQPLQNSQTGEGEHQLTVHNPEKSNKSGSRSYSRKRKSSAYYDMTPGVLPEDIEKRKHEPAEVILIFAEGGPLPSEMNLNKMFRRFGPLKELETEVHEESCRARVVFKRGSDAEVAHSSVGKFNIFGLQQVAYELSYSPVISFKPMLLTITPDLEGVI